MSDWQAISNFFIAISVGLILMTVATLVSLDLVKQVNPKSKDRAAALFTTTLMMQWAVIALAMTRFTPISSPSPIVTAFSIWIFAMSIYASFKINLVVQRWWGYV